MCLRKGLPCEKQKGATPLFILEGKLTGAGGGASVCEGCTAKLGRGGPQSPMHFAVYERLGEGPQRLT